MNKQEKLQNQLVSFCRKYTLNDVLIKYIIKFCKNRVAMGKILDTFNTAVSVELNHIETYWILKAIQNFIKEQNKVGEINKISSDEINNINIENSFSVAEIQNAESYFDKNQKTDTIIIPNVVMVEEDLFTTFNLPFSIIAEMFNNGIVNYNFNAQREATVVNVGTGEYLLQPKVYKDHVEDIKYNMSNNTFFTNHVVFNILDNGEQLYEYDEKSKTLKFTKTAMSQMNILDGYHRCTAITELINSSEGEYNEEYIQANIFMLNIEQAQNYITQEAKASPISESKKESFKKSIENDILKYVNTHGSLENNRMFNKISTNIEEVKKAHIKFAMQDMLAAVIEEVVDNEELKKRKNKMQIQKDLQSVYDYWIELHEDDFNEMVKTKKEINYKTTSVMFAVVTYFYLEKLYKNGIVGEDIIEYIDQLEDDFDLNEEEQSIFNKSKLTKNIRKKLYKLVDEKVNM